MSPLLAADIPLADLLAMAHRLADMARVLAVDGYCCDRPVTIIEKADGSPVTQVDRMIESRLRDDIAASGHDFGILGEEFGVTALDRRYIWVIDPIDGTRAFTTAIPLFGTLIGLLCDGEPLIGIVDMPILAARFVGVTATAEAYENDRKLHCRPCADLGGATIYLNEAEDVILDYPRLHDVLRAQAKSLRFGHDCYSYARLASGHIDAVIETGIKPHDFLPIAPLIEAAGGCISDWSGRRLGLDSGGDVLACGDKNLHRDLLALIAATDARADFAPIPSP